MDTKVGFSQNVDLAGGAQSAQSTYAAQNGLTFSSDLISKLLSGAGKLTTQLFSNGAGFSNLDAFFNGGGKITGFARLITLESGTKPPVDPGPGGNPVPEPGSLLVWGAIAAGAALRRKFAAA